MKILIQGDGVTGVRRTKIYRSGEYSATVITAPTRTWLERLFGWVWGGGKDGFWNT